MRVFAAVSFDKSENFREKIESATAHFRANSVSGRFVDPKNLHLTLKFFGEVSFARAGDIMRGLESAAAACAPFSLEPGNAGTFERRGSHTAWVGVEGDLHGLMLLQRAVEASAETLGFARERRGFTPHITVGRDVVPVAGANFPEFIPGRAKLDVRSFVLMETVFENRGSFYRVVKEYPLGG